MANTYNNGGNSTNASAKNAPPIRVELTEKEFRTLNNALQRILNYGSQDDQIKADKLITKILKYTRDVTDEEGFSRKRICFYESEAANLIPFLVALLSEVG